MKVLVLAVTGYNYVKDGNRKQGMSLHVCTPDSINESDGNGNFKVGQICDSVFVPRTFPLDANDLVNLVGKEVELVYERQLGSKFDRLADIKVL